MFTRKSKSHLGFPLANNKGDGGDEDNYGGSALFPILSCIQSHCTTPQKVAPPRTARKTMEKDKRKEESNPYRFLERNGNDERRHALIFLLFSSLLFLSLSPLYSFDPRRRRGDGFRVGKGEQSGTVARLLECLL